MMEMVTGSGVGDGLVTGLFCHPSPPQTMSYQAVQGMVTDGDGLITCIEAGTQAGDM
jgi:hypothetical protein